MKDAVISDAAPGAIGPYSQGIRAGNMIFVSGQIPIDARSGGIPEGISAQTEQSLINVREVLKAAGAGMEHVVEVGVFLKDMGDFAEMNEVYARFFNEPYPARAAIEASRLPRDVLVEIKVTAVLG